MTLEAIARLLNVRKEERWLVAKLFWMQFFQGAGTAFFFTSAYATFLSRHEVSDLTFVYICTSLALWLTGYIYSKLEHRYSIANLSKYIIYFMAGSILLIRLFGYTLPIPRFDYFVLIWFNVLYLLSNLEFWGIAALVFEVRQSKRLFSIISAGDIPAKFIGYTLASLTVSYVGTANLLIPAFLCMLASLPFLNKIIRAGTLHVHEEHHTHNDAHEHAHKESLAVGFIKRFTSNRLIFWLAILAFIMSVCIVVANFSFYSKIKEAYHDDIDFAVFIGAFLAVIRICALIVKLLFTGKLLTTIGVKKSLLFTPIIFAACIVMVIAFRYSLGEGNAVLYMFGATCIVLDVLKTAINSPVFLSVMQPLGTHDRLRSHNIVKGIMDPFAYLFSGVLLFELIQIQHGIDIIALAYFLLGFAVLWIISIFFLDREYYNTVLKAITSKFYTSADLSLDEPETLSLIRKKLLDANEPEVIHILRLIRFRNIGVLDEQLLSHLLKHPSDNVKDELLVLFQEGLIEINTAAIKEILLHKNIRAAVKHSAFAAICKKGNEDDFVFANINNADAFIGSEALGTLLSNANGKYYHEVAKIVIEKCTAANSKERIIAAAAIAKAKQPLFRDQLITLVNDTDETVAVAAISEAGKWPDVQIVETLLSRLKQHDKAVYKALLQNGELAVPVITGYLRSKEAGFEERRQLIRICGIIGGHAGINNLAELYHTLPEHTNTITKAIYHGRQKAGTGSHLQLQTVAENAIANAATILQLQKKAAEHTTGLPLISNSLAIELQEIRDNVLYLFAILFKDQEIDKIRRSLSVDNKEQNANAFEMLEMAVPRKLSHDFIIIYEKGDIEHRISQLNHKQALSIQTQDDIPAHILSSTHTPFFDWSKACAAYTLHKAQMNYDAALLKKYLFAENILLKETVHFTLNNVMTNKLLLLEKVLVLKSTSIFSETPEHILADLAPLMQEVEYKEGERIFEENAIGDSMYIIYQGSVRIHKGETTLIIFDKENDIFGELSLFDAEKRSASATAFTDCYLFKIDQLPFYELLETRPEIIKGAVKMLCKRLRAQNERTVLLQNTGK
ncbi:cyclic nucleotide-binding domain-containing protein [Panacibacter sp. DH6]|uniref:Cyclic nucleotide-binding domain-containing protein n=1 Tax=Panacibacter microcysteis TaxID=2793269 RepID=A0A931GUN3_9BACT|nr:cyclic nucleotide-binding domain-containing protein [Panacibacter microcysteis]MBG9375550.1 cyclic nucleotide-binding domain-containing protein [Panacibacter microcysteis]